MTEQESIDRLISDLTTQIRSLQRERSDLWAQNALLREQNLELKKREADIIAQHLNSEEDQNRYCCQGGQLLP